MLDLIAGYRWIAVSNDSGEVIPPHALLRVTGLTASGEFKVAKPNADSQSGLLINGPESIPVTVTAPSGVGTVPGCGRALADVPALAAYNTAATPAVAQVWGSASGSWLLTSGKTGYLILSAGDGSTSWVAPVAGGGTSSLPSSKMSRNAGLSVNSGGASTTIDWTNSPHDSGGFADTTNNRFNIDDNGIYLFQLEGHIVDADGSSVPATAIDLDVSTSTGTSEQQIVGYYHYPAAATSYRYFNLSYTFEVDDAPQTMSIAVRQVSGDGNAKYFGDSAGATNTQLKATLTRIGNN